MSEIIEDNIIRERVSINESSYKRILKLCQSLLDNPDKEAVALEFDHQANLFSKLEVQLGVGSNEIKAYEEKTAITNSQIEKLKQTTAELEAELADAQRLKNQREECNNLIASMLRAKKVIVDDTPIIALLDSSRQDDENYCASLEEEIQELEDQKAIYQRLWDSRKSKYEELVKYLQQFKQDIHETVGTDEELRDVRGSSTDREITPLDSASLTETPMVDTPMIDG